MAMKPVVVASLLLAAAALPARGDELHELPDYELLIRDGRFIPAIVEVKAGVKFRLRIRNEGPGPEEFESTELKKEKVLPAGASSNLIFQPLKPGSYPFFGEFHPQTAQGRIVAK